MNEMHNAADVGYVVVEEFRDLVDGGHYLPGETFPRIGVMPTQDRIEALVSGANRRKRPMIAPVRFKPETHEEAKPEEPKPEEPKPEEAKPEEPEPEKKAKKK